jgi:signal transduction histidine kinase/phage shock protein PspC (stress-responsive transcriptional regulator)
VIGIASLSSQRMSGHDASGARSSARSILAVHTSRRDRIIAGVAGGLGERLGTDPMIIRLCFIVLAAAGGFGILLYLGAWLVAREPKDTDAPPPTSSLQQTFAVACVVLGTLLVLRAARVWFGDEWVWPISLGALGSAIIWTRSDAQNRARWTRAAARLPGSPLAIFVGDVSPLRIVAGGLLIAAGMATFLAANDALAAARTLVLAIVVTATGAGLILGPALWRMARQLSEERRERIRQEERAEVAAHLHDSVLQTLALIQRTTSPDESAMLARSQERELRAWLYGRSDVPRSNSLGAAIESIAARLERTHNVVIDTVIVGDCSLDDRLRAAVAACGEAMTNAAKHSGAREVSVYVEVEPAVVKAYVRDQGRGFDLASVTSDRAGIAESIRARMERNGGSAEIVTRPGNGTEVQLSMPRPE